MMFFVLSLRGKCLCQNLPLLLPSYSAQAEYPWVTKRQVTLMALDPPPLRGMTY